MLVKKLYGRKFVQPKVMNVTTCRQPEMSLGHYSLPHPPLVVSLGYSCKILTEC